MALNVHNLIAAVSPDVYCDPSVKDKVKKIAREKGYKAASEEAKPKDIAFMDLIDVDYQNAMNTPGLGAPSEKHILGYDSFGEGLEPVYFWIFDKMSEEYKKVDKLIDNFVSSPGSGHFSELGMKATKMQEEAMKMMGAANQVIKSVLNILYDLKEFKLRIETYDIYKEGKSSADKKAALLSLKQIWMDTVDTKKGNSAILMLARNFDYVTVIDAFMAADSVDSLNKSSEEGGLDLNDRVRRILQQRVAEFFRWITESETELKKRFEIEKIYLKSQVNTVKLYARWAKPYFRAAQKLEQNANPTAALVTAFNTSLFELLLIGESDYKPEDDAAKGDLPQIFKKVKARKYVPMIITEFKFRTVPERAGQQGYGFRGKAEATFTSYALNAEEIKIIREEIEKDDLNDVLKLVEGATTESLEKISIDLEDFLKEEKKEKKEEKKSEGDSNPFSALFSIFKSSSKKEEKKDVKFPAPDSPYENVIRSQAIITARKKCYRVYDLYKKTHSMASMSGYA